MRRNLGQMSFLRLHTMIAVVCFAIPILQITICGLQPSISATWYTSGRDTFVGTLFLCGGFFLANKGYDADDCFAFRICGISFFMIALFPCEGYVSWLPKFHAGIHYAFAAILFFMLGLICIFLFTTKASHHTHNKVKRNMIYKTCGVIIWLCLIVLSLSSFIHFKYLIYFMETIMLYAFGTAFIVKGTSGKILNIHDEAA